MRKETFCFAAAVGFVLMGLVACNSKPTENGNLELSESIETEEAENTGVKLLAAITDEDGNVEHSFEYDKQNRIVKIDGDTVIYTKKSIRVGSEKYIIDGNRIEPSNDIEFAINENGYMLGLDGASYEYKDGNLIRIVDREDEGGAVSNYSYDKNNSPLSNCTTPKWLIQCLLGGFDLANKNNLVKVAGDRFISTCKYQYDGNGYPVKLTKTFKWDESEEEKTIIRFVYRGEKQKD